MMYAQTMKIASQQIGSTVEEITNTVATPMANPNSDSWRMSFPFTAPFDHEGREDTEGFVMKSPDNHGATHRALLARRSPSASERAGTTQRRGRHAPAGAGAGPDWPPELPHSRISLEAARID